MNFEEERFYSSLGGLSRREQELHSHEGSVEGSANFVGDVPHQIKPCFKLPGLDLDSE
jgi:hypothetical protein